VFRSLLTSQSSQLDYTPKRYPYQYEYLLSNPQLAYTKSMTYLPGTVISLTHLNKPKVVPTRRKFPPFSEAEVSALKALLQGVNSGLPA
jgi:hypothetical protein